MVAVEELDLTHLDEGFKLHLKENKSINVNDKNFWTKLRYFILCLNMSNFHSIQTFIAGRNFEVSDMPCRHFSKQLSRIS